MNDAAQIEEILARHMGLMKKHAHTYTTNTWSADDLLQEARIALWRESVKRPGDNLDKIASFIIKRRIMNLSYGEKLPFAARTEGEKTFSPKSFVSLEAMVEGSGSDVAEQEAMDLIVGLEPSTEEVVLRELSASEVRAAIEGLPERQRAVVEGKLDGLTDAASAEALGMSRKLLGHVWRKQARPALVESLAAAA